MGLCDLSTWQSQPGNTKYSYELVYFGYDCFCMRSSNVKEQISTATVTIAHIRDSVKSFSPEFNP